MISIDTGVVCDICGATFEHGHTEGKPPYYTAKALEARRAAGKEGWLWRKIWGHRADVCPDCALEEGIE